MRVGFSAGGPGNRSNTRSDTFYSEVSCVDPTSSMVIRPHAREGRSFAAIPDEIRPEPEIISPAEIQVYKL